MTVKLKTLHLNWFRGAGSELVFDTSGKSVVVYGPNGAGKSSLVDALEFVLTSGKIGHLASEYSGKRLENAVPNTHTPAGVPSKVTVTLVNGKQSSVTLNKTGMPKANGCDHVSSWSPTRSILRQDTVTSFINATKSDKYKSVLPLLGFEPLEIGASNLHGLKLEVERQTSLERKEGELASIRSRRQAAFPNMDGPTISEAIRKLAATYFPDASPPGSMKEAAEILEPELKRLIDSLDDDHFRHSLLCQTRDASLDECLSKVASSMLSAAQSTQPLLSERLGVLKASSVYTAALNDANVQEAIDCPACGRSVSSSEFSAHIEAEQVRLSGSLKLFDNVRSAKRTCIAALDATQRALGNPRIRLLWDTPEWASYRDSVYKILSFDLKTIDDQSPIDLSELLAATNLVMPKIRTVAATIPLSTQNLVRDQNAVRAAVEWAKSGSLRKEIEAARQLSRFLSEAENAVRDEIRRQSLDAINNISDDVKVMWEVLHPSEPIDGISLYQHADSDKAIDLKLSFHGKELPSPRLTLSEGHRNSLGLCVFLALAKKENDPSPIILDDVVTSFDREHRASVTDLLLGHMSGPQIIVLTHEYDWFIDLSNRLPGKMWSFQQIRPFTEPSIGIQWGGVPSGFEPAKELLDLDPSAAANKARGLLDVHLAVISEKLKISMPFVRGPRNELRHADDMLQRLSTKASKSFKVRSLTGKHETCLELSQSALSLKQLLIPFANPPSHGRVVTRGEADRIIKSGEKLLGVMVCSECSHTVTRNEVSGKHVECECGAFRWDI